MNYKENDDMVTDFDKAVSYLKNCVVTTSNTHINLYAVDTDIKYYRSTV